MYIKNHLYPSEEKISNNHRKDLEENPAFRFFGRRLYKDQNIPEFLNELMLILFSPKRLKSNKNISIDGCFPTPELLKEEGGNILEYASSDRLNLKIFAFWSSSRLDSRHKIHSDHFEELENELKIKIDTDNKHDVSAIIQDLEKFFLGLRSTGDGRTWCTQQFLPISRMLLTSERVWEKAQASRNKNLCTWLDALQYFDKNKYSYMSHGGDVLYCQLCLALSQEKETIAQWNIDADLGLSEADIDPACLRDRLEKALPQLMCTCPGVDAMASFINNLGDEEVGRSEVDLDDEKRYQEIGWCSADSWKEGYLFAVEILHILKADIDVMERLALLETACGLQVLRTLAARTAALRNEKLSWPGYLLPMTAAGEKNLTQRSVSQHACKHLRLILTRQILDQLPYCSFGASKLSDSSTASEENKKRYLESIAKGYASGLYFHLAKDELGLVVPPKGNGERFILPERILRLLVMTLVPAGKSLSLDTFKKRVKAWHGFVFDAEGFKETQKWLTQKQSTLFPKRCDAWLHDMLEDGNFLIHLSDACSLVNNPIVEIKEA